MIDNGGRFIKGQICTQSNFYHHINIRHLDGFDKLFVAFLQSAFGTNTRPTE